MTGTRLLSPIAMLLVAACGGGTTATPDLAVPADLRQPIVDLAVIVDLTPPPDLTAPTCNDTIRNGSETDIDCGGNCPRCPDNAACALNTDCQSTVCQGGACAPASCTDGVKNGRESDTDCGGGVCPFCGVGRMCVGGTDCGTGVCNRNVCVDASCSDGIKNGSESDTDCGGGCSRCGEGKNCNGNNDCASGTCRGGTCAPPACNDGLRNGTETDVDCGGGNCNGCPTGRACAAGTDCQSGVCTGGVCAIPSCTDNQKNGNETDVDCGGGACPRCAVGKLCLSGNDCSDSSCVAGACAAPACNDGIKNGVETDVDCGGGTCPGCAAGKACAASTDCADGACATAKCRLPLSCNEIKQLRPTAPTGAYSIDPDGNGSAVGTLKVQCEMALDGGGWTQVFHHNIVGGYFTGAAEALSTNESDPSANKYSILKHLGHFQSGGKFTFRINWPGYTKRNIWSQTTNPTTDVDVGGYVGLDIQSTIWYWGGLELGNGTHGPGNSNAAFIDGSIEHQYWYYAIGTFGPWGNPVGIPASDEVTGQSGYGVARVQLWIR